MWGISWKSLIALCPQYTFSTCVCSPLIASGIDSRTTFFRMSLFWSFIQNNHWKGSTWNWSVFLPCLREMKSLATVRGFQQVRFLCWFLLHFTNPELYMWNPHCKNCPSPLSNIRSCFSLSEGWFFIFPSHPAVSNICGQQRTFACQCFFGCKWRHQKASMASFPVFCRGR